MAELADAQDSGSCGLWPVGVQVPPFALLSVSLLGFALFSCQTDAERVRGEHIYLLEQVITILEECQGDTKRALERLDKFYDENRDRILKNEERGKRVMEKMSSEEKAKFSRESLEMTKPLVERINNLVQGFSDPPKVYTRLRQILGQHLP